MAKNPSFSYKQQNKGVWDHTTSGYLVQSFFFFLVVYSGVVVDACLDMLIAAWKEGRAWERGVIWLEMATSTSALILNSGFTNVGCFLDSLDGCEDVEELIEDCYIPM